MVLGFYSISKQKIHNNFNKKTMGYRYCEYYERRFFYDKEYGSFINSEIAHRHIKDFDRIAFLCLKLECLDNDQVDTLKYFKEIVTLAWNIREDWDSYYPVFTTQWEIWGCYLSEENIHKKLLKEWSPIFKEKYGFSRNLMMWDIDEIGKIVDGLMSPYCNSKLRMYIKLLDYIRLRYC